jgi:hypothetical protein
MFADVWPRAFLAAVGLDCGRSAVDVAGNVEAGEHTASRCGLKRILIDVNSGARHVHLMLACVAR